MDSRAAAAGTLGPVAPRARARFAYLLLTHKEPHHVEELAGRIAQLSPDAEIVVHHDLAAAGVPWGGRPDGRAHLVERGRVSWGDWSMVDATLRLLRYGTEHLDADWLVLLSGEHRPVVDLGRWETSTVHSGVQAIAPAQPLAPRLRFGGSDPEANLFLARSRHRWTALGRPRSATMHRAMGGLMKLGRVAQPLFAMEYAHRRDAWAIGTARRTGPMRRQPLFRGSQWIAFSKEAARFVLDVDPSVTAWFKKSWIPDETYFHTVLRRCAGLVIGSEPTTYVLRTPERPVQGWMRLTLPDLPAVWASGAPFARKVDLSTRPEVVDAIDREVARQRSLPLTNSLHSGP